MITNLLFTVIREKLHRKMSLISFFSSNLIEIIRPQYKRGSWRWTSRKKASATLGLALFVVPP